MVVLLKVARSILGYLAEEVAMPIQVERDLKISRYLVFGSLTIMEKLGLVEAIAKRANWKLYRITEKGRELLEKGKNNYRTRAYWPRILITTSITLLGVVASTPKPLI